MKQKFGFFKRVDKGGIFTVAQKMFDLIRATSKGSFIIKNYYCSPLVITAHISLLTTWSDLDTERAVI